jgi:hypothetical protein
MVEKRRSPRFEVSHTALYSKDIFPRPIIASILDLSMGGTKIESLYSLTAEEGLEISISIQSRVIKCRGRVVYALGSESGKMKAGIEFQGLLENDRLYLSRYLHQRAIEGSQSP